MSEKILSGKVVAASMLTSIAKELTENGANATLVIVQVGDDPASTSYIRQKKTAAESSGVRFQHCHLPRSSDFEKIEQTIIQLNQNPSVSAFMLQLPLDTEKPISKDDVTRLLDKIAPEKDADGLHTQNQGRLFTGQSSNSNWTSPLPATALGILRLLEHYKIPLTSKNVVVIGRSRLVGLPTALLCTHSGATVTICHSKTENLDKISAQADIVIAAAGKKHLVGKSHVHSNSVVIDVGIHVNADGKLCGDVAPEAYAICKAYTPVPGGVGPMTVAGLVENTAKIALGRIAK